MLVCAHVCMPMCVCAHVHVCIHVCVHVCALCVHVYTCIHVCACVCLCLCICVQVCVCACVCICMHICACVCVRSYGYEGQKLTLGVFFHCSPSYSLRRDLSLNLELIDWTRLTSQQGPWILSCFYLPITGITAAHPAQLLTWVLLSGAYSMLILSFKACMLLFSFSRLLGNKTTCCVLHAP